MDNTYNGWTNYETWLVNLHLTNDYDTYSELTEKVSEIVMKTCREVEGIWSSQEIESYLLTRVGILLGVFVDDMIQQATEQISNDIARLFITDMVNTQSVNWEEIAHSWIDFDMVEALAPNTEQLDWTNS
jgi:hypothetical protein